MSNTHLITLTETEQFFYDHAGFSYNPETETHTSGKARGAVQLAAAEKWGKLHGWTVEWNIDPDADTTPTDEYFVSGAPHWYALLRNKDDEIIGSLGSVDLGYADGSETGPKDPANDPYARVVAAELMMEAL